MTTITPPLEGLTYSNVPGLGTEYERDEERFVTDQIADANLINSAVAGSDLQVHKILLDLDLNAKLLPSSTEGHHHLYIDKAVRWSDYLELMKLLVRMGVLEEGYMLASEARGYASLRLPGVPKIPVPRCLGCNKTPSQLPEYVELAESEGYDTADAAVRAEEGTFNEETGAFWCSLCYVLAGSPLGVAA